MKIHSFISDLIVFLLILCAVIAPIAVSFNLAQQHFTSWTFPYSQLITACSVIPILIFYSDKVEKTQNITLFMLKKIFPGIFALCLLFCSALLIKGLTFLVQNEFWIGNQSVVLPQNFTEYLFCIISFLCAAFYEEVVYRFYLPEIFKFFVFKKLNDKLKIILGELLTLLLFASAHIYLGGFAVINALIGHVILRLCFVKAKSIWPGFTAHFIYNLLVLFLL